MSYFTDISQIDLDKYWYDEKAAESAVRYIETHCYHAKGDLAGTPLILEEWQKEKIIKPLFGWKEKEVTTITSKDGKVIKRFHKRKFRFAYIEVPKKNGKSTLLSAIAQIFLDIEPEKGAEVVGIAWGRKQAGIIFDMVKRSVAMSPRMTERVDLFRNAILSKDGEKRYTTWSKEAGGEDGQSPNLIICDELHQHKSGELIDMAEKSMAARSNPLSLVITTAGDNLQGIGYERSNYAKDVAQGIIKDESLLVCIYCANEKEDDVYDPKVWKRVNPQLGVSIPMDFFEQEAAKAKTSVYWENSFKRYHLNIWNNTRNQFISDSVWMDSSWVFDKKLLEGKPCFGGMDLSSTGDITAFSLVFPIDDYFVSLNWFFLPEDKSAHGLDQKRIIQYDGWVKRGYIIETPGNVIDYGFVRQVVQDAAVKYDVQAIAYDPYNMTETALQLQDAGLNMIKFRQGYISMNYPTKQLERLVLSKKFNHRGNPVLRWMNNNTSIATDPAGNIKIYRDKKDEKVDGMVSNVMALGLATDPSNTPKRSYLEESGGEIFTI